MGYEEINIKVNGKVVKANLAEELEIDDVSLDMERVAAQMSYWGSVWAAAESERMKADAYYRRWKANLGRELLEKDSKLAEWKVRQHIEGLSQFQDIKNGLATAMENATLSKTIYESFKVKASMLQSKGAMLRSELDATGMTTRAQENQSKRQQRDAAKRKERKEHMKGIFKGDKA